jgi:hypothetical protein
MMVKTMDKAEIKADFSARMLEMLDKDRDVFIQVLMHYVDDIGMGIAMEQATGESVSQEEFHQFMDELMEEE